MLNTSTNVPISERNQILQDWDDKMNLSGYKVSFRSNVMASALHIYYSKLLVASEGGRPVHIPSGWEALDHEMSKHINHHTWYHGKGKIANQAPLIIDSTPLGQMETEIHKLLSEASKTTGINIKLWLCGGRKMAKNTNSDPFTSRLCDTPLCKICTSTNSKGGCKQSKIGYTLSCDTC